MKALQLIKRFFTLTFTIFTVVTLCMVTYNLITSDVNHLVLATKTKVAVLYWQIMFFAAVTALSSVVTDIFKKLNPVIARIIKFIFSYAAFGVWFFVLSVPAKEGYVKPSVILIASMLFLVIYAIVTSVTALAKWLITRKSAKSDETYENVYDNSKI